MKTRLQIVILLLVIGQYKSVKAEDLDTIRTLFSIETTHFTGLSVFHIPSLSKTSQTYHTRWQGFGIRVHQELNSIFQINTGITFQSTHTKNLPPFSRNFETERILYKNKINFVTIPLGAKMSINLLDRKLFSGLSFALDLNIHQGKTKEYAADFSHFGTSPYKEETIFLNRKFYASQEVGIFVNYFVKERLRLLMSANVIFENEGPIILAEQEPKGSTSSQHVFDGNGIKFRFQVGYSILKSKPLFESRNDQ